VAVAFRTAQATTKTASGTTYTPVRPTGAVVGDLLWVDFTTDGATITAATSGWTQRVAITTQTGLKSYAYSKFYVSGDADPVFTLSAAVRVGGCMTAFTGVDATTPVDVTPVTTSATTGAVDPPSLASVTAGALPICGVGQDSTSDTFLAGPVPSGYTRAMSASSQSNGLAYKSTASVGGTENPATWTTASTTLQWTAYTAALRPSAGGGTATLVGTAATATATAAASTFVGDVDAITYVDSTAVGSAAVAVNTNITIAKPVGLQDNDYILMLVGSRAAADSTFIVAGGTGTWTELSHGFGGAAPTVSLWGKKVVTAASEPANYTYQFNQTAQSFAEASAYRGVDPTTPIHATATAATGSDATAEQSLTPTVNKTMLVFGTGYNASTSTTQTGQPSGYIQREHNTSQMRGSLFDAYQSVAAASSPVETNSGVGTWGAVLIALNPITAAGTPATLVGTAATATTQAEASAITAASKLIAGAATATTQAEASAFAGQGKIAATAATATAQASASAITAASKLIAAAATATAQAEASNFSASGAVVFPGGTATANATASQSTLAGQAKLAATAATSTAAAGASTFGVAATFLAGTATATAAAGASAFKAASKLLAASATATAQAESAAFLAGGAVTFAAGTATASAAASASMMRAGSALLGGTALANAIAPASTFLAASRFVSSSATASAVAGAANLIIGQPLPPPGIVFPAGVEVTVYSAARDAVVFAAGVPNPTFSGGG
jgi:hypothetical protein